ncbi:hypothetical protein M413DRAFT_60557 [Hebeloma cylindrosporum]|uniref:Mitochondrial import inner membrane translocase subunit TIM54 n=1 Tax=Hebeloma cylindrosporum TaxID=76867 RepID=A0A0C2YHY2_HEBCY|nr:hypothetical protein M413DRAFT_60557 [Hebeloma cylindrosporum h7]
MATPSTEKPPAPPVRISGVKTVLRYTGLPPSWLDKRPKLPSRNWLIFLSVTSSVIGLYVYDRRQCKKIRQSYVDKVQHLAEVPVDPFDSPRKVTVLGAKWPGDEDYDQSIKYFRKYVKPILVAAAVDYELVPGKRHGDIAKRVAEDVRTRRRFDLGLDHDSDIKKALPTYKNLAEQRKRELEGGIVIVGRPTFKEFMAGMCKGWTGNLEKVDPDEQLARILENDNHFDEPEDAQEFVDDTPSRSPSRPSPISSAQAPIFSPPQPRILPTPPNSFPKSASTHGPPSQIPPLPPLLLVPFTNHIGIQQIPLMIWGFFNQRHKVRAGAEAGYRLVMGNTRPVRIPDNVEEILAPKITDEDQTETSLDLGDLDFGKEGESYVKKSLDAMPEEIEKLRTKYYESLPARLATARELARGIREPTKAELENPPPTEVELRAERSKKERRWRDDLEGWEIIKPSTNPLWDERFRNVLRIFTDPPQEENEVDHTKSS